MQNLAKALIGAQAEMPAVVFDAENPFLHNQYATLGAIIEATRPVLFKFGLAITQFPITSEKGHVGIRSFLFHESGEYITADVFLPLGDEKGKSLAQVAGSSITYLRRYAWASILGLYTEEDTDGNEVKEEKKEVRKTENWKAGQKDVIMDVLADYVHSDGEAQNILTLSNLPQNATAKTIRSWAGYVLQELKAEKSIFDSAETANNAYTNAIKGAK